MGDPGAVREGVVRRGRGVRGDSRGAGGGRVLHNAGLHADDAPDKTTARQAR